MSWTYFFRRLLQNPSYYGMEGILPEDVNTFMTETIGKSLDQLERSYCIETDEDGRNQVYYLFAGLNKVGIKFCKDFREHGTERTKLEYTGNRATLSATPNTRSPNRA